MTEENCDPLAGWFGKTHFWAHCRGYEDACISVELIDVSETQARVMIRPSWRSADECFIRSGEYEEYTENGYIWRVYCDGVWQSSALANIRICFKSDDTPPVPCSDHETQTACEAAGCNWYDGACHGTPDPDTPPAIGNATEMAVGATVLDITLVRLICDTAQAVIDYGGKENTIGHAMKALLINPFIYVGIWWIDSACTKAYIVRADTTITPEAEQTAKDAAQDAHPTATPAEIDEASEWAKEQASRDARWQELLEQYRIGAITKDQMIAGQLAIYVEYLNIRLSQKDFTLSIPTLIIAGDVNVSGTAPQPNQQLEICASKKLFGFDFLAADDVLATVTSDAEYNYEAILNLDEFGIIEVYSRIPKDWWAILTDDITTAKKTVFVFTWEIIIFLIIAAALIYDKKTGKLGLLKRKR